MTLSGVCRTLISAALMTMACSDPNGPGAQQIDSLPRQLTSAEQKLVAGNNAFATAWLTLSIRLLIIYQLLFRQALRYLAFVVIFNSIFQISICSS